MCYCLVRSWDTAVKNLRPWHVYVDLGYAFSKKKTQVLKPPKMAYP